MAQNLSIKLARNDAASSWGFRLQGGKDFGTPLLIQKVNVGSLAEKAGLRVGDAVLGVNGLDVRNLRHKEAQDAILRAGNSFEISVQRGDFVTWKPAVSPVGSLPTPNPHQSISPVPVAITKTSLAASKHASTPSPPIPRGFNSSVKPFSSPTPTRQLLNGDRYEDGEKGPIKAIVNKQYNTPVAMYSDESIAETLSAQAEVLAGGVLGVNFKKNEKNYDAESSEVFKMLAEAEKEPPSPDASDAAAHSPKVTGLRHVHAPQTKPSSTDDPSGSRSGQNVCADCERLIVGVFVRIKDKNLHVECFKCATCGTSLKNVGYYNINNKLYCDIHAKMVAKQNPPVQNTESTGVVSSSSCCSPLPSQQTRSAQYASSNLEHGNRSGTVVAENRACTGRNCPAPSPLVNGTKTDITNHTSNSRFNDTTPHSMTTKAGLPNTVSGRRTNATGGGLPGLSAPRRGKGVWNPAQKNPTAGARIPLCAHCNTQIRGPFVTALGKIWCPEHFTCVDAKCGRSLLDIGFVEEPTGLYCEYCFERYLAPTCAQCRQKIKGDCLSAIGKHFHPECFVCSYCGKLFGNNPFFLEDGLPYCENDWNELFTTKCFACGFPIEAGDRWVEALNNNYHSPCFNCMMCKVNLEGQSFYVKAGRPYCKNHCR